MTKFFKKTAALILLTIAQTSLKADWWDWNDNDYDIDFHYHDTIDYPALKRIIEQEIDRLFQPHSQSSSIKSALSKFKDEAKRTICIEIKSSCNHHSTAKKLAITLSQEYALDFVADRAERLAIDKLKYPPVNPALINKKQIIAAIKQIIHSQAQIELSQKNGRLTKLVQNLDKNIEILIMQEIEYALGY